MALQTSRHTTARLGGALLMEDSPSVTQAFEDAYGHCSYIWLDLPDGTTLQLFYNDTTRLFVADVVAKNGKHGNEFVRVTVPKP